MPIEILWFGFVGAIAVYLFIGYQNLAQKNQQIIFNPSELSDSLFVWAGILALALIFVAHSVLPKVLPNDTQEQLLALRLAQFAFSEAIGVIGIVIFFLYGSFAQLVVLCAMAFISMLKLYPQNIR